MKPDYTQTTTIALFRHDNSCFHSISERNWVSISYTIHEGNWVLIHYISPLFRQEDKWCNCKQCQESIKENKPSHSVRLVFNSVPDHLQSLYHQCLSESGIVILEITRCQALPLRPPEWNLRFGSSVSFSWNFGSCGTFCC